MELINIDQLVLSEHPYREWRDIIDAEGIAHSLAKFNLHWFTVDWSLATLVRIFFLQLQEDLSTCGIARHLQENIPARWFCGFHLGTVTPSAAELDRFFNKIGEHYQMEMIKCFRRMLQRHGLFSESLLALDNLKLKAKRAEWNLHDKMLQAGYQQHKPVSQAIAKIYNETSHQRKPLVSAAYKENIVNQNPVNITTMEPKQQRLN